MSYYKCCHVIGYVRAGDMIIEVFKGDVDEHVEIACEYCPKCGDNLKGVGNE